MNGTAEKGDRGTGGDSLQEACALMLKVRDRGLLAGAGAPLHAITRIVNIVDRQGCYRDGKDGLLSLEAEMVSEGMLLDDLYGVGPSLKHYIRAAVLSGVPG